MEGLEGVILTMPEFQARLGAVEALRGRRFAGLIGVVAYSDDEDKLLSQAGANRIFHPLVQAGQRLAECMLEAGEEKA